MKPHRFKTKVEYPYVRIRGQYYPLIPLTLHFNERSVKVFGLLDSGASVSLFRPEIARALGIPFGGHGGQTFKMVKGQLKVMICRLTVEMAKRTFPAFIGFSNGYSASFNIIGRKNFFERFGVCFNESKRRVGLIPLSH